jgi:hypothetical protein
VAWEKVVKHHACEGTTIFGFMPEGSGPMGVGSIHRCDECGKRRELVRRFVVPLQLAAAWRLLSASA